MAGLAMAEVRAAFFSEPPEPTQLARAVTHAGRAIAAAPHLAEAQLAYGRVLLHRGDATGAAAHFRAAIACAPYLTEPHEWLGRLLLEAGFLVEGMARMADVLEMDPALEPPRWDLARAYALEDRWPEYDLVIHSLTEHRGATTTHLALALRIAGWRGDRATIARVRELTARAPALPMFERALVDAVCDAVLGQRWYEVRDALVASAIDRADGGTERRRDDPGMRRSDHGGGGSSGERASRSRLG